MENNWVISLLDATAWPIVILVIFITFYFNTELFQKFWNTIWKPVLKLKDVTLSLFGHTVKFNVSEVEERASKMIDISVKKLMKENPFIAAIPYASTEEINDTVSKFKALQIFGFNVEEVDNVNILTIVAAYHYMRHDYENSIKFYKLAETKIGVAVNKVNGELLGRINNCLGWTYRKKVEYDIAINHFSISLDYVKSPWAHLGLAKTYYNLLSGQQTNYRQLLENHYQHHRLEALVGFTKNIESRIDDYFSLIGLSQAHYLFDDLDKAISTLDKAIAIRGNVALGYYNRSVYKFLKLNKEDIHFAEKTHFSEEKYLDATSDLAKSITLNPTFREYALKDNDLNILARKKCYQCLIKQEFPTYAVQRKR